MKQLIPHFILDKFMQKKYAGRLQGATIFIDISGFTVITEALMKNGTEGLEVLTDMIDQVFTPSIDAIYQCNGFIADFAGDAFTAIFSGGKRASLNALYAAVSINKIFEQIGHIETRFGTFHLAVKIGLSFGTIRWNIICSKNQNAYYFTGPAIERCIRCEEHCHKGSIVIDTWLKECLPREYSGLKELQSSYYRVKTTVLPPRPASRGPVKSAMAEHQETFIPEAILNLKSKGEFRDTIVCFISFKVRNQVSNKIKEIIELTHQYDGFFNQIEFGDKGKVIFVVFGAPSGTEKIYTRACNFVLAVKEIRGFNSRISCTFGKTYCGFIGSKQREKYAIVGTVVNMAARFMTKANYGDIYLSGEIVHHIQETHRTEYLGTHDLKGFPRRIPVYRLIGKNGKQRKSQYRYDLIGRDNELQCVKHFIEPIFHNTCGGILYIDGVAGIGKSHFVNEVRNYYHNKVQWCFLPCDGILKKPFNPLVSFLKQYFQHNESDSLAKRKVIFKNHFTTLIQQTADDHIKQELIRTQSFLGAILQLTWRNSLYEQVPAKVRYENTLSALKNFFKALSLQMPVVLELDDSHWIDGDTLIFLQSLARNIESFPILLIASSRYNDDGSPVELGIFDDKSHRVPLTSLNKAATKRLLENIIQSAVPNETVQYIFSKSEGNPFYTEQIIFYLQDHSLFNGRYVIQSKDIKLPSTVTEVIIARIDRLKEDLKETIKTAVVLGKEFSVPLLSTMLQGIPLKKHLIDIENEAIWESLSELKYIFKHALIHETVYEMQLKKSIRALHQLAAESIEAMFKDQIEGYYADLAHHYQKAEMFSKAIHYLEKAGNQAKDKYENEKAIDFYDQLIAVLENVNNIPQILQSTENFDRIMIDSLTKKGDILFWTGKIDEAHPIYEHARNKARKMNYEEMYKNLSTQIGQLYYIKKDYEQAEKLFRLQLDLDRHADTPLYGRNLLLLGIIYREKGDFRKATHYISKSTAVFNQTNDALSVANAQRELGIMYANKGNLSEALNIFQDVLPVFDSLNDVLGIIRSKNDIATIYNLRGDYDAALDYLSSALELCKKVGNKIEIASNACNVGVIYQNRAEYDKALTFYQLQLHMNEEIGDKRSLAIACGNIGVVYFSQGDYKKAQHYLNRQLTICRLIGDRQNIGQATGNIGVLKLYQGQYDEAVRYFQEELKIWEAIDNTMGRSKALGNLGKAHTAQRQYNDSLDYLDKAIEIDHSLQLKPFLAYHLSYKAECLFLAKRLKEAQTLNEKAIKAALDVENYKQLFLSKLLREKISFQVHACNMRRQTEAITTLETMLIDEKSEEHQAYLHCELAKMKTRLFSASLYKEQAQKNRDIAINLLRKLYKTTPKMEYEEKIDALHEFPDF